MQAESKNGSNLYHKSGSLAPPVHIFTPFFLLELSIIVAIYHIPPKIIFMVSNANRIKKWVQFVPQKWILGLQNTQNKCSKFQESTVLLYFHSPNSPNFFCPVIC